MPEFVFSLEATDEFLKARIMNLPESVVAATHNTEEGLNRRLAEYRSLNTEDDTVLNYFDEFEIHPEKIGLFHTWVSFLYLRSDKLKFAPVERPRLQKRFPASSRCRAGLFTCETYFLCRCYQ